MLQYSYHGLSGALFSLTFIYTLSPVTESMSVNDRVSNNITESVNKKVKNTKYFF